MSSQRTLHFPPPESHLSSWLRGVAEEEGVGAYFRSPRRDALPDVTHDACSQRSFIVRKLSSLKFFFFPWNIHRLNTAPNPNLPSLGTACV